MKVEHCSNKNLNLKEKILFIFGERGRKGERERKKHQCVRETSVSCFSHGPNWGPGPATKACALTRNQTGDLLVWMTLNPLSQTSESEFFSIYLMPRQQIAYEETNCASSKAEDSKSTGTIVTYINLGGRPPAYQATSSRAKARKLMCSGFSFLLQQGIIRKR